MRGASGSDSQWQIRHTSAVTVEAREALDPERSGRVLDIGSGDSPASFSAAAACSGGVGVEMCGGGGGGTTQSSATSSPMAGDDSG